MILNWYYYITENTFTYVVRYFDKKFSYFMLDVGDEQASL